jgi:adenylate kinase
VVELKVDPDILVRRIESRIEQMKLRGEPLRADDNPEVLKQRLQAYSAQTAPLVSYYKGKGALRTVDGMASISDVSAAINRALAEAAFRPVEKSSLGSRKAAPARKAAPRKAAGSARKLVGKKAPAKTKMASKSAKTTTRTAIKTARRKSAAKAAPKKASGRAAKLSKKSRKSARGRRLTK